MYFGYFTLKIYGKKLIIKLIIYLNAFHIDFELNYTPKINNF